MLQVCLFLSPQLHVWCLSVWGVTEYSRAESATFCILILSAKRGGPVISQALNYIGEPDISQTEGMECH